MLPYSIASDLRHTWSLHSSPIQPFRLWSGPIEPVVCQGHSHPALPVPSSALIQHRAYSTLAWSIKHNLSGVLVASCTYGYSGRYPSNKPMESVPANWSIDSWSISSWTTKRDGVCRLSRLHEWEESEKGCNHNHKCISLSLSAPTLALVEEGRGDNLRFKD